MRRIGATLGFTLAVAASLLAFPQYVPVVAGAWLSAYSVRRIRGHAGNVCAATLCLIVLLKNYPLSWAWAALAASLLLGAAVRPLSAGRYARVKDGQPPDRVSHAGEQPRASGAVGAAGRSARVFLSSRAGFALALLWIAWGALLWDELEAVTASRRIVLDPARPIVCWGDSLTAPLDGHGGYPAVLAERLGVPVMNLGVAGQTLAMAPRQWPQVLGAGPQLVVVELGGNDFLRGRDGEAIRRDLTALIQRLQQAGCTVVLVEVPRGFIRDPLRGVERKLAREFDLTLVPDGAIRSLVLRSPAVPLSEEFGLARWSDDGLHPNATGCVALADAVTHRLRAATIAADATAD